MIAISYLFCELIVSSKLYLLCSGVMDVAKSELSNVTDPKIVTQDTTFALYLTPRDRYGNSTSIKKHLLRVNIREVP